MFIIINAGHSVNGNPDPGAIGNGYKEAIQTAKLSNAIVKELKTYKINSLMIQQEMGTAGNAQLNAVVKSINSLKPDYCISVHMNWSANNTANGIETLYTSEAGKLLASAVQDALKSLKVFTDRGIKKDTRGLALLKMTNMPACLTEVGFISNKKDADYVDKNIDLIGKKIAEYIAKFLKVSKPAEELTTIASKEYKIITYTDHTADMYIDGILKYNRNKISTILEVLKKLS